MIDVTVEQTMSLSDAAQLAILPLRRGGKRPSVNTLLRWATVGVRGVKLETVRWGDGLCTSEPALIRFMERLSAPLNPDARTSEQGQSHAHAEAVLSAAGI